MCTEPEDVSSHGGKPTRRKSRKPFVESLWTTPVDVMCFYCFFLCLDFVLVVWANGKVYFFKCNIVALCCVLIDKPEACGHEMTAYRLISNLNRLISLGAYVSSILLSHSTHLKGEHLITKERKKVF